MVTGRMIDPSMRDQAQLAHHDRFYDHLYRTENYFGHREMLYRPYIRSLISLAAAYRASLVALSVSAFSLDFVWRLAARPMASSGIGGAGGGPEKSRRL